MYAGVFLCASDLFFNSSKDDWLMVMQFLLDIFFCYLSFFFYPPKPG